MNYSPTPESGGSFLALAALTLYPCGDYFRGGGFCME